MTSLTKTGTAKYILPMALLFALTPLLTKSQPPTGTWIEIHVNGPWDFLPYPADAASPKQIVLIAPEVDGHDTPVYLSGPHADQDADSYKDTTISRSVLHVLTISNLMATSNCPSYPPPAINTSVYNYPNVPPAQIQAAIDGTALDAQKNIIKRYAIVLPQPNYTSGKDVSYSAIDVNPIQDGPRQSKPYTTWMVLHYCVNSEAIKVLYDKTNIDITSDNSRGALSFVMRSDMNKTAHSKDCDDKSIASVSASAALLGLTGELYALFPTLTNDEWHQTATWDSTGICKTISKGGIVHTMTLSESNGMRLFSAGSGDCHKTPIAVNGAIQ